MALPPGAHGPLRSSASGAGHYALLALTALYERRNRRYFSDGYRPSPGLPRDEQTTVAKREMKRILVIRGGAIGDFILTLPALKALREANPDAEIDVLGYKHIAELVNNRFFAKDSELCSDLKSYFAGFDLVVSYLFDPDQIFENNVRRCGVGQFIRGPAKIDAS